MNPRRERFRFATISVLGAVAAAALVFPGCKGIPTKSERESRADLKAVAQVYRPGELLQPEDIANAVVHALAAPATAEITDIYVRPAIKGSDERQFRLARNEKALSRSSSEATD